MALVNVLPTLPTPCEETLLYLTFYLTLILTFWIPVGFHFLVLTIFYFGINCSTFF